MLLVAGIFLASLAAPPARAADVSFGFFYSNLSSHGSWMVSGSYGNVWQPRVYHAGWNPYHYGHWVYTDLGWTWASDYAWGGIPYHYGTWVLDPMLGWVWVPGYVWAPSWVVFRHGPDYVGWAPVPPSFTIGMSFSSVSIAPSWYTFVPVGSFAHTRVRNVIVPQTQVNVIVNRTKIVTNNITIQNNVVVNKGLDVNYIERESGRRIRQVPITQVRNVTATGRFDANEVRVDPARVRGRRVAEPARGSLERERTRSRGDDATTSGRTRESGSAETREERGRSTRETTAAPSRSTGRPDDRTRVTPRKSPPATSTRRTVPQRTAPADPRTRRSIPETPPPAKEPPRARPERPIPQPPVQQSPRLRPEDRPPTAQSTNPRANESTRAPSKAKPTGKSRKPQKPAEDKRQSESKPEEKK
jgi:hypothetical protein